LQAGDVITVLVRPMVAATANPNLALDVRFESRDWVVVAKPAGQPSAPRSSTDLDTLANALVARYPELATVGHRALEPGLLHRLDNGTSGLLVAARHTAAFAAASQALKLGQWSKRYLALVQGNDLPTSATIRGRLVSDRHKPERVNVPDGVTITALEPSAYDAGDPIPLKEQALGAPHETRFIRLGCEGEFTYVEVAVSAAFRHQIRAHFAALGWPLLNDTIYGANVEPSLAPLRHALHAARVAWVGSEPFPGFDVAEPVATDLAALLRVRGDSP
jgi:23S rRNA pseudouridine1911/1915/1917 synthase